MWALAHETLPYDIVVYLNLLQKREEKKQKKQPQQQPKPVNKTAKLLSSKTLRLVTSSVLLQDADVLHRIPGRSEYLLEPVVMNVKPGWKP